MSTPGIPNHSKRSGAEPLQVSAAMVQREIEAAPASDWVVFTSPPPLRDLREIWASYREGARRLRAQYPYLYEQPVTEYADGSRSFHDGLLYRVHGLNVLFLRGDFVEMAFQHGRLLADQIPHGALPESARLIENAVANTVGPHRNLPRWLTEPLQNFSAERFLSSASDLVLRALPDVRMLDEAVALSDATGTPIRQLIRAFFNPEMLLILAKLGGGSHFPGNELPEGACVTPGCCTSFAAWGSYTVDGNLLVGRNMDYPLNGYYDRFPTVIYFEPTVPVLKHMSFVSAGIHNSGITSYNEAGLFLASHVVPSLDVSLRGVPAFVTADLAIRRARTFDTAAKLFEQLPSASGWSYLLASTREQKIGSLERTNRHFAIREAQGECHVQTNRYLTPKLRAQNLFLNRSVDEDSDARYARAHQRLEEARGRLDVQEAISVLGDQVDPLVNQVRGLGNTVGVHTTLTSVVLDPSRGRVLVSTGPGPAPHFDYVELPLVGTFDRRDFLRLSGRVILGSTFPQEHREKLEALELFIQAKIAYESHNDVARAFELLKEIVRKDPSNPAYFFQLGIFALKNRQYDEATGAFDEVFHCPYLTDQLRRLSHYYRGRTQAHLGKAGDAQTDLEAVLNDPRTDHKLRAAAQRSSWRTKAFGRCNLGSRSLAIMMQQSDMLNY